MKPFIFVILICLGTVALVFGIIAWVRHLDRKRREALQAFADDLKLAFHASGHDSLRQRLGLFKLFKAGHSRKMKNVIIGETDFASIAIFDYQYTTGGGKHQQVHYQTVVAMESHELQLPCFSLRPENMFDWFGSMIGLQDIDFDQHPQFSQMFVLKGEKELAIKQFFNQELLDFFAQRSGIAFECQPGSFIYFRSGRAVKVDALREFMNDGYAIFTALCDRCQQLQTDPEWQV